MLARFSQGRLCNVLTSSHVEQRAAFVLRSVQNSSIIMKPTTTVQFRSVTQKAHSSVSDILKPSDMFHGRHIGPTTKDVNEMLKVVGSSSLEQFISEVVPSTIRLNRELNIDEPKGESDLLAHLKSIASKNKIFRSHIGMGYYGTLTPNVILRNIIESPAWYTPYTPYQAEIAQGRLQSLLNFQTGVGELTKMEVVNASLLDEATAAAEAMAMCFSASKQDKKTFVVSKNCHPQSISLVQTRAGGFGVTVRVVDDKDLALDLTDVCGVLFQYPDTHGHIYDHKALVDKIHEGGALCVVSTDLLALCALTPPGEFGADIVFGSAQRFGVPMGYGGPHAAFFATKDKYKRSMPGRLMGVSKDSSGKPALRMSLQTREQHIRREKATSNICTAQALLANVASFYMIFHGPEGLRHIAQKTRALAAITAHHLKKLPGVSLVTENFFDTIHVKLSKATSDQVIAIALSKHINLRRVNGEEITISFDETCDLSSSKDIVDIFSSATKGSVVFSAEHVSQNELNVSPAFARTSPLLTHPVFSRYTSETDVLRYIYFLQGKDLGLQNAMIPLGSCTMKLNATAEMIPVTWPEFNGLHPFAPVDQAKGYAQLFEELERYLIEVTGFAKISLQPNSGAQGEYAGLLAIAQYHKSRGDHHRNVCLIPTSAHGTNPASAAMAGMAIESVACDEHGNVDVADLKLKIQKHGNNISCLMITYPSTHGVFEESIKDICKAVHDQGGLVYMDGANMNAQVGLCRPGDIGADVCHLNLHKTFCIPHGGGGPGMGPIGVVSILAPFLPTHPVIPVSDNKGPTVSAAPWGSASILPISWTYIRLMGGAGLAQATKIAILNANYIAERLQDHYKILYRGSKGRVAHELILDLRPFKAALGISETDIAKRLLDYSFHAPTMSFPVSGTLMIEPTESEGKHELDRFCDALISIRQEIREVEEGKYSKENNVLKHSPHTLQVVSSDTWDRPYSREKAAFPLESLRQNKFWPSVGRLDDVYGDKNLVCSCPPLEFYL